MPAKIYRVTLTDEERAELTGLVSKGKGVARRITRSRILLLADENHGSWHIMPVVALKAGQDPAHGQLKRVSRQKMWI